MTRKKEAWWVGVCCCLVDGSQAVGGPPSHNNNSHPIITLPLLQAFLPSIPSSHSRRHLVYIVRMRKKGQGHIHKTRATPLSLTPPHHPLSLPDGRCHKMCGCSKNKPHSNTRMQPLGLTSHICTHINPHTPMALRPRPSRFCEPGKKYACLICS